MVKGIALQLVQTMRWLMDVTAASAYNSSSKKTTTEQNDFEKDQMTVVRLLDTDFQIDQMRGGTCFGHSCFVEYTGERRHLEAVIIDIRG